jgi:hypothetical protein
VKSLFDKSTATRVGMGNPRSPRPQRTGSQNSDRAVAAARGDMQNAEFGMRNERGTVRDEKRKKESVAIRSQRPDKDRDSGTGQKEPGCGEEFRILPD